MSQNFDLGLRYLLCYVEMFKIYFFIMFHLLWHKMKTRALLKLLRQASLEVNIMKNGFIF